MDTVPNETRIAPEAVLDLLRQQVSLFVKLEAYAQRQRRLIHQRQHGCSAGDPGGSPASIDRAGGDRDAAGPDSQELGG